MSMTTAPVARGRSQLTYLRVGLFGAVMGLTGLSVAWRLARVRQPIRHPLISLLLLPLVIAFVGLFARTLLSLLQGDLQTLST